MSIVTTWQTRSTSSAETENLASKIGRNLKGGEVIELVSDLGGGKTTFVRGLARGVGSLDKVASPTFTIKREYRAGDLTIHHFDFYRIHEPGDLQHELAESLHKPNNAVVIEWADIIKGILPAKRLTVRIKATGESTRQFDFSAPKQLAYLIEGLK